MTETEAQRADRIERWVRMHIGPMDVLDVSKMCGGQLPTSTIYRIKRGGSMSENTRSILNESLKNGGAHDPGDD
jgi:hypothetical protein